MIKPGVLLFLSLLNLQFVFAQQKFVYDNQVYNTQIKTVQCYNVQKEQSIPVITLGSTEQLSFSFDDLSGGSKDYWYTIEHCTFDWKSSDISVLNYLDGSIEDRIINYAYSSKTLQKFTHYTLTLPNEQIRPKISGNYLLKVYENGDQKKPVCSQRFFVTDKLVNVGMEVIPSNDVALRFTNQKVNVTLTYTLIIQNPYNDIKVLLMQNGDPLTTKVNTKPTYVKPGSLIYNEINGNDFMAGNEFRKFDFRSFRYKGVHVQDISMDSTNNIILFQDLNNSAAKYTLQNDDNGAFFIRNQDNLDNDTDSDYAHVLFTLKANSPGTDGDVYVTGRFNNFTLNAENKLRYDISKQQYAANLYLKQGVYDYRYVWKNNSTGTAAPSQFEGSFFETENTYQTFVYFRKPGNRWDELIGYSSYSNSQR
jgi:hypothetical protein